MCKNDNPIGHKFRNDYNADIMKTKTFKKFTLALLLTTLLTSCSSQSVDEVRDALPSEQEQLDLSSTFYGIYPYMGYQNYSAEARYSLLPKFQNFKKRENPKQSFIIANMIAVVQPELDAEARDKLAISLARVSKQYNIKPEIFVAIIDTESNFNSELISSTGDLSMAQINVEVWNREFKRMNLPLIDKQRVRTDVEYTFAFMAEILNVLKIRYESTDPIWYARYHSSTPKFKYDYFKKLAFRLNLMERSENLRTQIAQIENIEIMNPISSKELEKNDLYNLNKILTIEPMNFEHSFSPKSLKDKAIEYAKNFVFETIKL